MMGILKNIKNSNPGTSLSNDLAGIQMPAQKLVLAAVAVKMSVAQMLKLQLSFVKVSVAVVAGADGLIPLPCFDCC